jgi:hypothetical protein
MDCPKQPKIPIYLFVAGCLGNSYFDEIFLGILCNTPTKPISN